MGRRRHPPITAAVALVALVAVAGAQSTGDSGDGSAEARPEAEIDSRRAGAREAFRLGAALARQGQWTEALAAFERSARLLPHATTTYNVGFCERALGRYSRARKSLRAALDRGGDELGSDVRAQAESYLAEIERRIARVTVHAGQDDLRIAVDGRPLELEASGPRPVTAAGTLEQGPGKLVPARTFVVVIDPGSHVFEISRGARTQLIRRTFAPGSSPVLELALPDEPRPTPAAAQERWDPTWTVLAFGTGAAGVAVGAVAGVAALKQKSDLDESCTLGTDRCDPRYQDNIDAMNRNATISTIGFGVGLVGVGVGTVLLLTRSDGGRERGPDETATVGISPWIGLGAAGLDGTF
jgi:hypothetical protein